MADYISNLFAKSGANVVDSRGVERTVLPEVIQRYDKGLESIMTPKVYTCGAQIFIVVDEELDCQESLPVCEVEDLVDLMKDRSVKRHEICDSMSIRNENYSTPTKFYLLRPKNRNMSSNHKLCYV